MWFAVSAEAEHSEVKGIKALYARRVWWKDGHHLQFPSLPLPAPSLVYPAVLLPLY